MLKEYFISRHLLWSHAYLACCGEIKAMRTGPYRDYHCLTVCHVPACAPFPRVSLLGSSGLTWFKSCTCTVSADASRQRSARGPHSPPGPSAAGGSRWAGDLEVSSALTVQRRSKQNKRLSLSSLHFLSTKALNSETSGPNHSHEADIPADHRNDSLGL